MPSPLRLKSTMKTHHSQPHEANAAALETVVALVERLADEDGTPVATDGALHVAEDYLVPNENTIRNSATKDGDRGELLFRTRVSFVADVRRAGFENVVQTVITGKAMYQSG